MRSVNRKIVTKRGGRDQVRREKDPIPWRFCLLTLVCGTALVGGFFLAARTHFAAIEIAIRNSSMKKQIEDLEAEKRRLMWVRETALVPAEIRKTARKFGFVDGAAQNFVSLTPETDKTLAVRTSSTTPAPKSLVQKTVDVKPAGKTGPSKSNAVKEISPVQIARN